MKRCLKCGKVNNKLGECRCTEIEGRGDSVPPLEKYKIEDATHLLRCCHAISHKSRYHYFMKCILLGYTSNGNVKLCVFGDRYWKRKEHMKKIRYVQKSRVVEASQEELDYYD